MDLYKPVCKYFTVPLWAKWEKTSYLRHMEYLEKSQYFPEEKVKEIQLGKIRALLNHAYEGCGWYRRVFDRDGIRPGDVKSFEDFHRLPILKKDDVLKHKDELFAPDIRKEMPFLTSGSTGKPLSGWWDKACVDFKRACGLRSLLWSGCDLGDRVYCLYGNPEKELSGLRKVRAKIRRRLLYRTEILDMLQMSESSMLQFADKMRAKPPGLLWGHAHGLFLLAGFLEKRGIGDIRPKGMYSAGMVLHGWEREKVEKVFNCKLQDRYGCEELGLIATECKEQQGLHINTDDLYVEFLGKDGLHAVPGASGGIVVTDLHNYAMPLIRYSMEDIGVHSARQCSCGRTQPLIEKIEGRVADFLITPEGKLVSGISLTDHFAGHIPGVAQIQILQDQVDLLTLRIVQDGGFGERSEQEVTRLVSDFFGPAMRSQYEFVDKIPQEPSGKYRFTICRVEHDFL